MDGTTNTSTWITHSRVEIEINKMGGEHLLNAIAMIDRGSDRNGHPVSERQMEMYDALVSEAKRRSLRIREDGWDA